LPFSGSAFSALKKFAEKIGWVQGNFNLIFPLLKLSGIKQKGNDEKRRIDELYGG
jgi:hypothetical protein